MEKGLTLDLIFLVSKLHEPPKIMRLRISEVIHPRDVVLHLQNPLIRPFDVLAGGLVAPVELLLKALPALDEGFDLGLQVVGGGCGLFMVLGSSPV